MNINETALILQPPEVLNVVTTGAHLLIDASRNVKTTDLFEARNDAESKYPEEWVEAEMITKDKESHIFINQGASWLQGRVKFLSRTGDINTGT